MSESQLFVPLHRDPFWKFWRGEKTVEVRQARGRWNNRNVRPGRRVLLSLGYGKHRRALGNVGRVAEGAHYYDLPQWARKGACIEGQTSLFFDHEAPVIAFEVIGLVPLEVHDD